MKLLALPLLGVLFLAAHAVAQPVSRLEQMLDKAAKLSAERRFAEAAEEITRALELEPNNARLFFLRAEQYRQLDRPDLMLDDVAKAAAVAPADKQVLYQAAQIFLREQKPREAQKLSEQIFALGDADARAWTQRVYIKMRLDDFAAAYEDAAAAAELFPDANIFSQYQATILRLTGDSEKSLEMHDALIGKIENKYAAVKNANDKRRLEGDLTSLYFNRAGLRFAKQDFEGAKSDLRRAVEFRPNEMTYLWRAQIYRKHKLFDEALADLAQAMKLSNQPTPVIFLIERGDVYFCQGKYAEAIADFEEVVRLGEPTVKEPMQTRIALARRKIEETTVK